ncbi:MAG: PA2169 family four-helix-bundle protein [Rhodanobacter sp.]|nr:MAG: PA2169 family four-helix-bundle protein [Rhodanobacter sp.]
MTDNHEVKTLNNLIETTLDSADGYEQAAKEARDSRLAPMFNARSAERRNAVLELKRYVRSLGGEPEEDGTILASAHRMFLNLRTSLTSHDTRAVVDEVERGEDHIKSKFEDALKDTDLSQPTRAVINDVYRMVRSGHDQMSDLKKNLHGE